MDGSIRQILDPRVLTASYEQMPGSVPTPLSDYWFTNPENIDGDTFRSMYDPADITPAPGNLVGSEARVITMGNASEKVFNMFFTFNKTRFGEDSLNALREPDSYTLQNKGKSEVTRIMNKFVNRQRRFKELVLAKILTAGAVYMNEAGTILESSSGATVSATFQVAATHQGSLNSLITAMFSLPGTDIPTILETIDDAAAAANVPPPTDVWVNKKNLTHLRNNNAFKLWAKQNDVVTSTVLKGGMIEDLWGKTWHFSNGYYTAADGTNKPYIPITGQGSLVLTPPPGPWCKASQGSSLVPKSIEIKASVDELLNNFDVVYGPFAYAKLLDDPVSLLAYIGDKFGFNFNEPNAIWQADAFA